MALSEQFTVGLGTILGVQAVIVSGITTLVILDMHITQSNLGPTRGGTILLSIDGIPYRVSFTLTDETLDQRTLKGVAKVKDPKAVVN